MNVLDKYSQELAALDTQHQLRTLPQVEHHGAYIHVDGKRLFNLSSNDYLGIASDTALKEAFLAQVDAEAFAPSSSSSRLLTGNYPIYEQVESQLARAFGAESSLVFNSGYHMNLGILPAVTDAKSLILADKLVHASLIDGIRLSAARCIRYRHNDYAQLRSLLEKHHQSYERIIIVTESIFSMDGDEANLPLLVELKQHYNNVLLYVDEAHAFGVRGPHGLGCAEQYQCIPAIDFIAGTFGKALGSVGAYVICKTVLRDYLINKMRPFIFTTALPPICLAWTSFVLTQLPAMTARRAQLHANSDALQAALLARGYRSPSTSHIIPLTLGASEVALEKAQDLRRKGFYVLPVRPPTVPVGTSRLRFSMTPLLSPQDLNRLITEL